MYIFFYKITSFAFYSNETGTAKLMIWVIYNPPVSAPAPPQAHAFTDA